MALVDIREGLVVGGVVAQENRFWKGSRVWDMW